MKPYCEWGPVLEAKGKVSEGTGPWFLPSGSSWNERGDSLPSVSSQCDGDNQRHMKHT